MLVKTLKRHRYGKQVHVQGDEYEIAEGRHLRLLEAVGRIRRVPVTVAPRPCPFEAAVSEPVAEKKTKRKSSGKRKYKRKDMVAEE